MSTNKWGLNVHGGTIHDSDTRAVMDFVRKYRPNTMLVLNNPALASWMADEGVEHVILRMKLGGNMDDDSLYRRWSTFDDWWNESRRYYTDKRLIVHVDNEPSGEWTRIAQFAKRGMQRLHDDDHVGVFLNLGVGNPDNLNVWNNELADVVTIINNSEHYLGLHEYFMLHPNLGTSGYGVDSNYNLTGSRVPDAMDWILGRWQYSDCDKILITEFGTDDVAAIRSGWKLPIISGILSHLAFWNKPQDYFKHQMDLAAEYYDDPRIKGICWFCAGNSGGWELYNILSTPTVLDYYGAMNTVEKEILVKSKDANSLTNFRDGPSSSTGRVIGSIPKDWTVATTDNQTSGKWLHLTIGGKTGWVHTDYVDIQEPTQPVDEINVPGFSINLTPFNAEERSMIAEIFKMSAGLLDEVARRIENG